MESQTSTIEPETGMMAQGVKLDVVARNKIGGGIDWSLDIKTVGHGSGNKIDLPKDNNYELEFTLDDQTGIGLRFDASAPVFVREGGAGPCPTGISTPQIMVDSCNARKLVLKDWNYGQPVELYYQLNFVDTKGLTKYAWDPVIINGGGGFPPLTNN